MTRSSMSSTFSTVGNWLNWKVCDRFNSVVERFNERPFLILELECRAKVDYDIFSKVLSDPQDIKCGHRSTSGRKTSSVSLIRPNLEVGKKCTIFKPSAKIGSISSFVRINTIYIDCLKTSTAELLPLLRQFSSAIYHPYVCIGVDIKTPDLFSYCLDRILPLFDGCKPQFEFQMHFDEPSNTMPVIGSILQPPFNRFEWKIPVYRQ